MPAPLLLMWYLFAFLLAHMRVVEGRRLVAAGSYDQSDCGGEPVHITYYPDGECVSQSLGGPGMVMRCTPTELKLAYFNDTACQQVCLCCPREISLSE